MVRETRYLWVGNLPEKIVEERIVEYFGRYGKIQSVKVLANKENERHGAIIAFMDIKSAAKAHTTDNLLDGVHIVTEYSEPGATGRSSAAQDSKAAAGGGPSSRKEGHEDLKKSVDETRNKQRTFQPPQNAPNRTKEQLSGKSQGLQRGGGARSPGRSDSSKRHQSKSPEGSRSSSACSSHSGSAGRGGQSLRNNPHYSFHYGSKSGNGGRAGKPAGPGAAGPEKRKEATLSSTVTVANNKGAEQKGEEGKRPNLGILIRGLPVRSSDTSLRDGLFHENKKYGKVTSVNVMGSGDSRYAIVSFKKPEDGQKALEASHDKLFFGTRISVTSHEGFEVEDADFKPPEAELDEYHPKATRTLFVGNLEKDISSEELREIFTAFGEILDIDIKKQGAVSAYAFVQYSDIQSVVRALRKMDGEHIGSNKIKLGFGKSMPTNCVWIDCVADTVKENYLCRQFSRFGAVSHCVVDRTKGRALVYFDDMENAVYSVGEMRGRIINGKKIQIDFASRDCQTAFYDKMERSGQLRPGDRPDDRRAGGSSGSGGGGGKAFQYQKAAYEDDYYGRDEGSQDGYFGDSYRGGRAGFSGRRGGRSQGRSGGRGGRGYYDDEFPDRRRPSGYEEYEAGYGDDYETEIREYAYRQQERTGGGRGGPAGGDESPPPRGGGGDRRHVRAASPPYSRSPDRYEEAYPRERFVERYRDTDSQSGDKDSLRSYNSRRSDGRSGREYRDDRLVAEAAVYEERTTSKRERTRGHSPASSDYSHGRSPTRYRSRSPSPSVMSRKSRAFSPSKEDYPSRSSRASSPGYDSYGRTKDRGSLKSDKSRDRYLERERRDRYESEERTHLSSLIGSKSGQMFSDAKKKSMEEFERASSIQKKRLSEEFARERGRRIDRHQSHSREGVSGSPGSTKMGAPRDIPDVIAKSKHKRGKVPKPSSKRKHKKDQPYDPFDEPGAQSESTSGSLSSSGSSSSESDTDPDPDSRSGAHGSRGAGPPPQHADVIKLQKEKDHLLKMIQKLDDDGGSVDEDGNHRPHKRARIEDVLNSGRDSPRIARLREIHEQLKAFAPHGYKTDSSLNFRKQIEMRRNVDQSDPKNLEVIAARPRQRDPLGLMSPQLNEPMDVDETNSGNEKSPRETSDSLSKKKRKDTQDDGSKGRRFRGKPEDAVSSGDEDAASLKSGSGSAKPRLSFEGRKSGFESEGSAKSESHDRSRSNSKTEVIVPLYVIGPDCPQDPRTPRSPERDRRDNPISLPLPKFGRHMHSAKVGASPRTVPVTKPLTVTIHNTPTTASAPVSATSLTNSPHLSPGSVGMVSPTFSPDDNSPKLHLSPMDKGKSARPMSGPDDLDEPPPPPPPPPPGKQAYVEAYITSQQQLHQEMQQQAAAAASGQTVPCTPDKDSVFTVPSTDTTPKDTTPKSADRDPRRRRDSQTNVTPPVVSPVTSKPPSTETADAAGGDANSDGRPSLEERIRALDEKLNITQTAVQNTTKAVSTTTVMDYREKFKSKIKKRGEPSPFEKTSLGAGTAEPSDIVKSLLSRKSIFDQDSRRLENIDEKYEPKEGQRNLFRSSFSAEGLPPLPGPQPSPGGSGPGLTSPTSASSTPSTAGSEAPPRFPSSILRNKEALHPGMLSPGAPPSSAPPAFMGIAPAPPQSELLPQSTNSGLDMFPFLNTTSTLSKQNSDPSPNPSQPFFRKPSVEAVKHSSSASSSSTSGVTANKPSTQIKKESTPLVVTAPSGPNVSPVPVRQESTEGAGAASVTTPPLPTTPITPTSILKKESAFGSPTSTPTTPTAPNNPGVHSSGHAAATPAVKKEAKDSSAASAVAPVIKKESGGGSAGSSGLLGKRKASDDMSSNSGTSSKDKPREGGKPALLSHKSASGSSAGVKTEPKSTDEPDSKRPKLSSLSASNSKDKKLESTASKTSHKESSSSKKVSSSSSKHSSNSSKSPDKKHKTETDKRDCDKVKPPGDKSQGKEKEVKDKETKEKDKDKEKETSKDKPKQENESKCKPDKPAKDPSNDRKGDRKDGGSRPKSTDSKSKDKSSKDSSSSSQEKSKSGGSGKSDEKSHKGEKHKSDKHHSKEHSSDKSKSDHSDKKEKSDKAKNDSSHSKSDKSDHHGSDKKSEQKDKSSKDHKQSDKKIEKSNSKDTGGAKTKHVKEKELKDKGGEDRGKFNTSHSHSSSDKKKSDKEKSEKKDKARAEKTEPEKPPPPPPPPKRKPRVEIVTTSDSDSESDSSDYEGLTEKEKREMIDMKMALMLQQEEIELGHSMYDMVRRRRSKDAEKEENERKIAQIKRQLDELRRRKRQTRKKQQLQDLYSSEAESGKDSAKETTTADAKSEQQQQQQSKKKDASAPKPAPEKRAAETSSSSDSDSSSDSETTAPEVKRKPSGARPPLRREDAITSDSDSDSDYTKKPKSKKPVKKKKQVSKNAFDSSSSDSDTPEKKPKAKKKPPQKSVSNDKKAVKKKPSVESAKVNSKHKNDKKVKLKARPHITYTEDDSDTDEYPLNKKSDKKKRSKSVLESDTSDSDSTPMLSSSRKQSKVNMSVTTTTTTTQSSDSDSDSDSEPVRPLTKAEKKAKVFAPKTDDNKKKEKPKEKKLKKVDSKEDAKRKKKERDGAGAVKNKVHKKASKENNIDAIRKERQETIAKVFGFSDSDSNLSPFPKDKPGKKSVLGNLFEFEQDGSSSDLPELVVETTSSKPKPTSFLERLENQLADEKPKDKKDLVKKEHEIKLDVNGDRDKMRKKKKKKKPTDDVEIIEIKDDAKSESRMPALDKNDVDAKNRQGDNIFEKMKDTKEEPMPILESENISSDDVDKVDDYGDPPSDLQIETRAPEQVKKAAEKVPALTEDQRRAQLEKAVAGIIDDKPKPMPTTAALQSQLSGDASVESKNDKQEEAEGKDGRVDEDLEAASRLAAMLEGLDGESGIPAEEPEPDVPVVVEEQQEEVITDNTPPGMQDEASLALQALKASAASSESEDNEPAVAPEPRRPDSWASIPSARKPLERDDSSKTESEAEVQQETPSKKKGRAPRKGKKKPGASDTDLSEKDAGLSSADETPKPVKVEEPPVKADKSPRKVEESPTPLIKPAPLFNEPKLFEDEDDETDRLFISETSPSQPEETAAPVVPEKLDEKPVIVIPPPSPPRPQSPSAPAPKPGFFRSTFVEIQGPPPVKEEESKPQDEPGPPEEAKVTPDEEKMPEAPKALLSGEEKPSAADIGRIPKPDASIFGFSLEDDDIDDDDDDDEGKLEIAEDLPETPEKPQSKSSGAVTNRTPIRARARAAKSRGRGMSPSSSVPSPTVGADEDTFESPVREVPSNQRSPTRAGTRASRAAEEQAATDQRYSSRGRKIIPKERDDELLYGRKGRKAPSTPEPAEPVSRVVRSSRRGAAPTPTEPDVSPKTPSKRTRTRSLRGYQDDEDSKASEDADTKEDEASETEAGRLTPRATRRSTRRSGRVEAEADKDKDKDEDKADDADLPDIESPKLRSRGSRRIRARKSTEGPAQSPRRNFESFSPTSPRARLESGSTSPKATPVVKLEKINIDQTLRRVDSSSSKEDSGSSLQSPPTTRLGKFITRSLASEKVQVTPAAPAPHYRTPEKDVFEWEDDDEKPVPKLLHKQTRKRRGTSDASGTEGSVSPTRQLHLDDVSVDSVDVKKSTKPVVVPEEQASKIAEMPKEAEPPVQRMPEQTLHPELSSPTERHLPPKLELKREKELAQLHNEQQTVVPGGATVETTPSVAIHAASAPEELLPDKMPSEWSDNVDRVIDEVVKGNFTREEEDYDFYDKKKIAGRAAKSRSEIDQLSPSAKAMLGLPGSNVSPSPALVASKTQVAQPPLGASHASPAPQQLPPHHPAVRAAQAAPVSQTATSLHQGQVQLSRPQVSGVALPHSSPASVIQQTPHTTAPSVGQDRGANPLQAMQHVGYPEGSVVEHPFPAHVQRQQTPPAVKSTRSPDTLAKPPSQGAPPDHPATSRGHSVQVGVVSKPFNLSQQDTSCPPGQVIEIVPNPNLQSPVAKETPSAAVADHHATPPQKPAIHSLPQQPPQHPGHRQAPVQPLRRDELTRELLVKQQNEMKQQLIKQQNAQIEKAVQQRLEQHAQMEQQQQLQKQQLAAVRGRENRDPLPPRNELPRNELPPHIREQMPPYVRVDGFGSQVSPHARVPTPQQHPDLHVVDKKGHVPQGHLPPHLQGFHPRPGVPPHGAMVPPSSVATTATSELRAVLSQPTKLAQQQEQQLIQQRIQQQQLAQAQRDRDAAREREAREAREREHLRPRTPHQDRQSPGAPIISAHHRLPFPVQDVRPPSKIHAEPKVSPSAMETSRSSHVQPPTEFHLPPKDGRDGRPGSAFNPLDGRLPPDVRAPGMPHPERMGVPPHLFSGDVRFPHPGLFPSGALPRMGMDPRMIFPPGPAEHLTYLQHMAFADKQMQNLIAQQHGVPHSPHEIPMSGVGSRPPSRPTSAQPSPGVTPSPHPQQHSPGAMQPHQPHPGMVPAGPPAQGRPSIPAGPVMGTGHEAPLPGPSDPLFMLLQRYPLMWQGLLCLKNDNATVQMHFLSGNQRLVEMALPQHTSEGPQPLRIAQRMRLEQTQLDGVSKRMVQDSDYSMLLALPCGRDHSDITYQTKALATGFIQYLQQKQAAGIVNVPGPHSTQPAYVVHIFPPCDFSNQKLTQLAPDLIKPVSEFSHLLIIIATV